MQGIVQVAKKQKGREGVFAVPVSHLDRGDVERRKRQGLDIILLLTLHLFKCLLEFLQFCVFEKHVSIQKLPD